MIREQPIRSLKPPTGFCVVIRRGSQADTAGHTGLETSCDTITVDWNLSLCDLLQKIQTQAADMIAFEQTGLQPIKQINQDTKRACQFQTLLMIQPIDIESSKSELFSQEGEIVEYPTDAIVNFSEYVLTLECQLEQQGMRILANFDSTVIDEAQVTRILQQLEHILRQLLSIDMQPKQLKQLHMLNDYDSSSIWQWNSLLPTPSESCLHDLIAQVTSDQPEVPAVNSWDGEITYRQLNDLSTELAYRLCKQGVRAEVLVPICLEKSMWMAVAILAVLKSGGAFVPIDIFQSPDRSKLILDEIQPIVVVTSRKNGSFVRAYGYNTIYAEGTNAQTGFNHPNNHRTCSNVKSAAYVIFTSGSTGKPKGVVVEHQAASTSILAHGSELGFCQQSKVLQFASHSLFRC
ncbi:putative NRPS-like protein biosynthetic cluster [Microsporum ferrugineum]